MALINKRNKGYAKFGSNLRKYFQLPQDGDCKLESFNILYKTVWSLGKIHIVWHCRHMIPKCPHLL